MKKVDLFDLMDACPDGQVDLHQDVPLSPERIKEITMNRIPHPRRGAKRLTTGLLVAAALAAVMSVTALAGYVLGAGALFQDFFAARSGPLSDGQIDTLNRLGTRFEGGLTVQGTTITPVAALADENVYYLRLQVEAPEGVVLPDRGDDERGYYQFFGPDSTLDLDLSACGDSGFTAITRCLPDACPTDGEKEFVLLFEAQPGSGLAFNDGITKPLALHGLWVQDSDKEYTQVLGGDFVFDIGVHFESSVLPLDSEGLAWSDPDRDCTSTVKAMELSPLSLLIRHHVTCPDPEAVHDPGPISVVLKDGTVLRPDSGMDWGPGGSYGADIADLFVFSAPLDLNEVDHVTYGDHTIPVRIPS